MFLVPEGQTCETGEPSKKTMLFPISGSIESKVLSLSLKRFKFYRLSSIDKPATTFLYFVTEGTCARYILRIFAIFIANENCTSPSSPHISIAFSKHCFYLTYLSARVMTTLKNPTHCPYNCYLFSKLCALNSPLILCSDIVSPMSNP
jgi:hypothetical protein